MPSYGYNLMCELYDPNELLAQAARAEAAVLDFVTISYEHHSILPQPVPKMCPQHLRGPQFLA
jgi:hypothetical protein